MKSWRTVPVILAGLMLIAALAAYRTALAQTGQLIGSRTVSDDREIDTIQVRGGQGFTAIRLCVSHRAVNFHDLDILFANGAHQDASIRRVIPAGHCTRWIDLSGTRRNISLIQMQYDTRGDPGPQAIVSAFGRR